MSIAIVVAAGKSERMKAGQNKPFLTLAGKPLLVWTLEAVADSILDDIMIVVQENDIKKTSELVDEHRLKKVKNIISGGTRRQDSVSNALSTLTGKEKIVAIHDGARPLATADLINKLIRSIGDADGIIPGISPADTIKQKKDDYVKKTLNRKELIAAQTPQVFKKEPLLDSFSKAENDGFYSTDDASLLERYGYEVKIAQGSYDNIKITNPTDLKFAHILLTRSHN